MTKYFSTLKKITAMALLSIATFACADVIRCEGEAGDVTYTNTACGSDVQATQLLMIEKSQARNASYQQRLKLGAVRSNWANTYIAPRTGKVDTESVRSAYLKMIAMDGAPRHLRTRNKSRILAN